MEISTKLLRAPKIIMDRLDKIIKEFNKKNPAKQTNRNQTIIEAIDEKTKRMEEEVNNGKL